MRTYLNMKKKSAARAAQLAMLSKLHAGECIYNSKQAATQDIAAMLAGKYHAIAFGSRTAECGPLTVHCQQGGRTLTEF